MAPTDMTSARLIRVDQSGNGDFKKIQEAIDSVPSHNNELVFIWVKPGTYREKIVVPEEKPFITISGSKASDTIITWNQGTDLLQSPVVSVFASDFIGRFLTIQNTFGTTGIAVALRVSADRAAFYGCRIISFQDTLLDDAGRHYFKNCYIEGATDFICGNAASLYERCHLHSTSDRGGAMTAQHRNTTEENTGFVFLGGKITGSGSTFLGRPWGDCSKVVFGYTYMSNVVEPQGWNDWGDQSKQRTVLYGEYKCYGPGANRAKRVAWSRSLSTDEAAKLFTKDIIGGRAWLRPAPSHFKRG
ncbi:putative pectinesterase 11 [Benincasa hispida]|uniref:putative pectinesterase 11 n=1 Tax=Benincasa hispida TaxID=102211 RepID=UPI0018FF6331|nr:putative pectinesterase 11 [Benincasa hispida]